jgi:hypothetical protein
MANGIHESLESLAFDISLLESLHNNPRRGDVNAIMASYAEFGQIKPIVIRPNGDGTATVIAGNHQLEAAKLLGWDKIAAVQYDVDDTRAMAFAIADNRTMELGYTEPELLEEFVLEMVDFYPELLTGLGWDEFSTAEIEQRFIREDNRVIEPGAGFMSPVINSDYGNGFSSRLDKFSDYEDSDDDVPVKDAPEMDRNVVSVTQTGDGKQRIDIMPGMNQNDAVTRGSTTIAPGSAPRAVVQYTIVFDNTDQQARWYEFMKWLKADPAIAGVTMAEKLIDFIDQHIEI